jgi:hypothetical protein
MGALMLALGRWTPLYDWLQRLPVFNWFRVPARFLLLYTVAVSVLSGMGLDVLRARLIVRKEGRWRWGWLVALAVAGLLAARWALSRAEMADMLALWRVLPLGLAVAVLLLILAAYQGGLDRQRWGGLAVALVVLDLGAFAAVYGLSYNRTMPRARFNAVPRSVGFLQAQAEEMATPYRVLTHEEILPVLPVMRASLYPNIPLRHGIQSLNGYYPLIPRAWAALRDQLDPVWLNWLNVKYFVIPQVLPVDEASAFYDLENPFSPSLVGRELVVPPTETTRLVVESFVSHSVHRPDGTAAAEITLTGAEGRMASFTLRIGEHTAEWAYDRSDVVAEIAHQQPPVIRSWPARSGFPPEDHRGYVYGAAFDLDPAFTVTRVVIRPLIPRAYVRVERGILVGPDGERHLLSHLVGEGDHTLVYRDEDVAIYENHDAWPRAYLVSDAVASGSGGAVWWMGAPSAVGGEEVLEAVQIIRYAPNRVTLRVKAEATGYLVLADAHYPGWRAELNGQAVPIQRANGYLRAVRVPPGNHMVRFIYRPRSFWVGAAVSGSTLVALIVLSGLQWRRRGAVDGG